MTPVKGSYYQKGPEVQVEKHCSRCYLPRMVQVFIHQQAQQGALCLLNESACKWLSYRALAFWVRASSLQELTCSGVLKSRGRGYTSIPAGTLVCPWTIDMRGLNDQLQQRVWVRGFALIDAVLFSLKRTKQCLFLFANKVPWRKGSCLLACILSWKSEPRVQGWAFADFSILI